MKKGISPLIATILIVGFTIVLAALVMRWTGTFFTTTTTETSEASEVAITCVSNIQFSVQNSCIEGNKIKLLLKNEGQDIQSFIVQVAGGEAQTTETLTGLAIYSSDNFIANYTSIPYTSLPNEIERVKIFPKILVNGEEQVCSEINYVPSNLKTCVDGNTIGYWSFDGNAEDSSGNGNDGTINGNPVYEEGIVGSALEFNGDDFVNVADDNSLDLTTMTLEAWVYVDNYPTVSNNKIISKWGATGSGNAAYDLSIRQTGGIKFSAHDGATSTSLESTQTVPLQAWNHVIATLEGTTAKIYINGENVETTSTFVTPQNSNYPLNIGREPVSPLYHFTGFIDEVRISNIARTF